MSSSERPLPPGQPALPLVGDTLTFLGDQYRFLARNAAKHGAVFRSNILFRPTAVLSGPDGTAAFNDESKVVRAGGMPSHVVEFFGGESLPLLDGDAHRARKAQVMAAFRRDALAEYLPDVQSLIEASFTRWSRAGEVRGVDEFKRLALEAIARNMLSMGPGPELDSVRESFAVLSSAFAALPIPLPGTAFSRALKARDRILGVLRRAVAEHRARAFNDGLARVLMAEGPDRSKITDEGAVLELHHFNIAGFLVFTMFVTLVVELHRNPSVRERLALEIAEHSPAGAVTFDALHRMHYLQRVVKETKRYTPFVPVFFGKARADFEFNGYRIPAGWMVLWGQYPSTRAADVFTNPDEFDPERFSPERAEDASHPCAFSPQGAGELDTSHKCAGYDYSTLLMQVFTVVLLRGYDWELPPQNLDMVWKRTPPEPTDGLRVRFTPRVG